MDFNEPREDDSARRMVDHVVDYLAERAGVRHVFGVHGANIEDLFDAVLAAGGPIRAVIAKHEFSAGTMADGYHRTGNRLAVVAATSGGGALNLVAALGEAYASEVPVLAFVGQPPTALEGRGAFQDQSGVSGSLNGRALFSTVTRFCERVEKAEDIARLLPAALAATARGPAVLLLPKDIQQDEMSTPDWDEPARTRPAPRRTRTELHELSGDVVIIAGPGVVRAGARADLARLADALDAYVAVEPDAKDAFDNSSPRFLGVAGTMGHPAVRTRLAAATACVLVGTRLPQGSRAGLDDVLAPLPVIAFHHEPPYVDGERALLIDDDLGAALTAAAELFAKPSARERATVGHLPVPRAAQDALTCKEVVETVAELLPADANVVSDAGNTGAGVVHYLPAPRRGRHVLALGMGGMGFSFGAGLGAAFATGRRTYVLAGDGSFFMHGMEIHTAVEYDLPVTFVVLNNNAHAMCVTRESLYYPGDHSYNRFRRTDIGAGVDAMFPSLPVLTVRDRTELPTLQRFLLDTEQFGGPALVCVELPADEVPPFLPFLPRQREETA
jgi:acetolactate synthase-1/2/3 large subunit